VSRKHNQQLFSTGPRLDALNLRVIIVLPLVLQDAVVFWHGLRVCEHVPENVQEICFRVGVLEWGVVPRYFDWLVADILS
jgi:hypothetical protein